MGHYYSCDPSAMVVALDPSAVLSSTSCFCTVELHGTWTRGQMVADWRGVTKRNPNAEIVTKLDTQKIMERFEAMLK